MNYRLVLLGTLMLVAGCFETGPATYANLSELKAFQAKEGFVEIGRFGDGWPAKVKREKIYRDEVCIVLANQEMHTLEGYEGYKLKVVTLQGPRNSEIVVAFRSKEKE